MQLLVDQRTEDKLIGDEHLPLIERSIETALKMAGYTSDYEISFSIVDQDEIRNLNRDYRGKDEVTDVLSFPLYEGGEIPDEGMLGDIVICAKRAEEQAEEFGHSYEREISYLSVHSTLHLLGYDHEEDDEKSEMRKLEKEIMRDLGVFK